MRRNVHGGRLVLACTMVLGAVGASGCRSSAPKTSPAADPGPAPMQVGVSSEVAAQMPTFQSLPYAPTSAWNTPIGSLPQVHPDNAALMVRFATKPPLTSDPTQYTFPIYEISSTTPRRSVTLSGYFSTYVSDDSRKGHGFAPTVEEVPVPPNAVQSPGSDGTIVFWNPATGDEWAFWQWREVDGRAQAVNGYHYNTNWSGRFYDGLAGRGAGFPYFAGLVRPWEVAAGRIDHAIAFAYAWPSREAVPPASKSDGRGLSGTDLPEGTRLQLDPSLTEADFDRMGLVPAARIVARALQDYGMIVVDNSGSTKIMLEDNLTANWGTTLTRESVTPISLDKFRVLAPG